MELTLFCVNSETTRWHLRNHNCRHILLGISHDAGYAPFLDETLQSEATRQRISIIEGVTTVPDLVATNINIAKLGSGLFRDDKLLDKFPSFSQAAPPSNQPTNAAFPPQVTANVASRTASPAISASSSQTRTPIMSYAGIVGSASPPPQITLPFTRKPMPSGSWRDKSQARAQSESQYLLIPPSTPDDWNPGHRGFDEPIRVNTQVLDVIKKRKDGDKLCNNHYLRGPCAKREICPFAHDYKISDEEMKAVAVLARQNPCSSGQYCELDDCIYGHHVSDPFSWGGGSRQRKIMSRGMLTFHLDSVLASERAFASTPFANLQRTLILPGQGTKTLISMPIRSMELQNRCHTSRMLAVLN